MVPELDLVSVIHGSDPPVNIHDIEGLPLRHDGTPPRLIDFGLGGISSHPDLVDAG